MWRVFNSWNHFCLVPLVSNITGLAVSQDYAWMCPVIVTVSRF